MTIIQEILHAWSKQSKYANNGYYIPLKHYKQVESEILELLPPDVKKELERDNPEKLRLILIQDKIKRQLKIV